MSTRAVRAPGKAMLFGEYAVLDGAWGVVAAVDRYATAILHDGPPQSPFVAAGAAAARTYLAGLAGRGRAAPPSDHWPLVDSSPLYASVAQAGAAPRKLGLGSSAAVTVAAFGAILEAAGALDDLLEDRAVGARRALPAERGREAPSLMDAFTACDAAHGTAQGARGSGLDVAAAVWGGVSRARRGVALAAVEPLAWPAAIALILVDTGVAASTADRVARYRALDRAVPANARVVDELRRLADRFNAARLSDLRALCEHVTAWNARMDELAARLDVEIATPAHHRIAALAAEHGGCAKPSGAGGGDLAVCFAPEDAAASLRARLQGAGFPPLDVKVGARGLHPTLILRSEFPS